MRFFWKLSFMVISVTVITFSAGGCLLIGASFRSLMEDKLSQAFDENIRIQETLGRLILDFPHNGQISTEDVKKLAASVKTDETVPFRIGRVGDGLVYQTDSENQEDTDDWLTGMLDCVLPDAVQSAGEGRELSLGPLKSDYQKIDSQGTLTAYRYKQSDDSIEEERNQQINVGREIIPELPSAHKLTMRNGKQQIKTLKPVKIEENVYYVETTKDVMELFQFRENQLRQFRGILIGLTAAIAGVAMLLSYWLTQPLKRLSRTAREITLGNLDARPSINSQDEIGELAVDFNRMVDWLETQIHQMNEAMIRQKEFMASFAHETKTPLTSIIGYAGLLRSRKMTEERTYEAADTIFQEGQRLEGLASKLMEIVVLEKKEISLHPISVQMLMESVKRIVLPALEESHIFLHIQIEDARIAVDYDLIKTVLFNLIDNSRKAMEEGGKLFITGTRQGDCYRICVRDTGIGIPKQELVRVKEPFYMVDKSRERSKGGAGLGLALCETIVKLHHGRILVTSEETCGTSVILELKEAENEMA